MGRVTLLAWEENSRDWGQGHFLGNQGVGWLKVGKRAEGRQAGMLMPQESFSEMLTKSLPTPLLPPPVWEVPGTKKRVWSEIAASVPSTFDSISIPSFASNLRQIRQKNSKQQVLERGQKGQRGQKEKTWFQSWVGRRDRRGEVCVLGNQKGA